MAYADDVTVLRKGRQVGTTAVSQTDRDQLANWMMRRGPDPAAAEASPRERLSIGPDEIRVERVARKPSIPGGDPARTARPLRAGRPRTRRYERHAGGAAGEILGLAGVSGNGQKELVEALAGQRRPVEGEMQMAGPPYGATREEMTARRCSPFLKSRCKNACVAGMSWRRTWPFAISTAAGLPRRLADGSQGRSASAPRN